jgi:tRNA 2-selenouridine synthase
MVERINASQIADYEQDRVVIDVRSPSEYAQGHIPNAINIPLFSDEEREKVGTIYKRASPEKALLKGLDFVGRKMSKYIGLAKKAAPNRAIVVYCWRGGKRSGSLSWLFDLAGFDVKVVEGGYKAYRSLASQLYGTQGIIINRIGGKTGTGKTEILQHLQDLGEQIIDLENLAHHKGSAFGELGETPAPTTEQFENNLYHVFSKLDLSKRIWVENESRGIGKIFIPQHFWDMFSKGSLYNVHIPHDLRIKRLVVDYANFPKEALVKSFYSIEKKLGGQHMQAALEAIENDDFGKAAEIALVWYDKTYNFGKEKNNYSAFLELDFNHADMRQIAEELVKLP